MRVLFLQDLEKTLGAREILGGGGLRVDHGGRVEVESTPEEGSTFRVLLAGPPAAELVSAPLPFTAPYLLAPMGGVTEPCFRDLVLRRNPPERLGGGRGSAGHSKGVPQDLGGLHCYTRSESLPVVANRRTMQPSAFDPLGGCQGEWK